MMKKHPLAHPSWPWTLPFALAALTLPAPVAWGGETIVWNDDQGALTTVNGTAGSLAPSGSGGSAGNSTSDALSGNSIAVIGGAIAGSVFGAIDSSLTESAVTNNSVTISGGAVAIDVYGGLNATGAATNNLVMINGQAQVDGFVFGGYSADSHDAIGNRVIISGHAVVEKDVTGGDGGDNIGLATHNSVVISGGATVGGNAVGAFTGNGGLIGNSVVISDNAHVLGNVSGGINSGGLVANNSVLISGGRVEGDVWGGYSINGSVTGNSVVLSGGQVDGFVYGGYSAGNDATGNSVTFSGGAASAIWGGSSNFTYDGFTGNVLNVTASNLAVTYSVANFQYLNFTLPANRTPGSVMLSADWAQLTDDGTSNGESSVIGMEIASGGSALKAGERITLIETTATKLTVNDAGLNKTAAATQGVSLNYIFAIGTDNDHLLWADVASVAVNPQTKALPEGRAAGLAFVNQGADLIGQQGFEAAMMATDSKHWATFGALSAGSSRYNTGSHVDVDGMSMMAGISGRPDLDDNSLLVGAFLEAGWGKYDSLNSFANAASIKGDGDTNYYGAGLMARYDVTAGNLAGLYADGSLRAGRAKTDFSSTDLIAANGQRARYDSAAAYYGAQAALGYVWNVTAKTSLDLSSAYLWTHQNSDSVTVANDPIRFDAANSHRWRNGGRLLYALDSASYSLWTPYVGAYHDYEFDGKANATAYGYAIDAPTLKGSTGIGETGFGFKPAADSALSLDLGVQGYVGVREGVAGRLLAKLAL